jgi:hypothetical protein
MTKVQCASVPFPGSPRADCAPAPVLVAVPVFAAPYSEVSSCRWNETCVDSNAGYRRKRVSSVAGCCEKLPGVSPTPWRSPVSYEPQSVHSPVRVRRRARLTNWHEQSRTCLSLLRDQTLPLLALLPLPLTISARGSRRRQAIGHSCALLYETRQRFHAGETSPTNEYCFKLDLSYTAERPTPSSRKARPPWQRRRRLRHGKQLLGLNVDHVTPR